MHYKTGTLRDRGGVLAVYFEENSILDQQAIDEIGRECRRIARGNHGVVASYSRALVEGLSAQQADVQLNALLDESIESMCWASNT